MIFNGKFEIAKVFDYGQMPEEILDEIGSIGFLDNLGTCNGGYCSLGCLGDDLGEIGIDEKPIELAKYERWLLDNGAELGDEILLYVDC